jgi:hypothetical protein
MPLSGPTGDTVTDLAQDNGPRVARVDAECQARHRVCIELSDGGISPASRLAVMLEESAVNSVIKSLLKKLGKPHLVEFDYRDTTGMHHGRCYVRGLFAGEQQVKRMMRSFGYRNIRIA